MDDMTLFDRFHAAFDVAPPAGGFERLRRELSSYRPARRGRPAFDMRHNKMTLRLAAVAAVAVIAIALVAAYVAGLHNLTSGIPAGSGGSPAAYQAIVAADSDAFMKAPFSCPTVSGPSCSSDVAANRTALQKWLDDLKGFSTPPRFAVVDAQMRIHLNDLIQKMDDSEAALTARDQTKFDSALHYIQGEIDWLDLVGNGIVGSRSATATEYTDLLKTENDILFGASSGPDAMSCASVDDALCTTQVSSSMHGVGLIFGDLARNIPPSSLADKASTLGQDLAQVDDAYLTMYNALYKRDLAGLKTGEAAARDAWIAVASDLQS